MSVMTGMDGWIGAARLQGSFDSVQRCMMERRIYRNTDNNRNIQVMSTVTIVVKNTNEEREAVDELSTPVLRRGWEIDFQCCNHLELRGVHRLPSAVHRPPSHRSAWAQSAAAQTLDPGETWALQGLAGAQTSVITGPVVEVLRYLGRRINQTSTSHTHPPGILEYVFR